MFKVVSTIQEKMAKILDIDKNDIGMDKEQKIQKEICNKATSYDRFLALVKEKINNAESYAEKVQLLTLAPDYWYNTTIQTYFNVTAYAVKQARNVQ